ncbi:MAG: DNA-binding protein WhiA [Bacilli bacterium]|nr:DNA-binding protein WhiA [Bacilli bacterium]
MSYTVKVKDEIIKKVLVKSESIAQLSGFVRNNGYISNKELHLTTENKNILENLKNTFRNLYELELQEEIKSNRNFSKKDIYLLSIVEKKDLILRDLGYYDEDNKYLETPPEYIVGSTEEIKAYLRGVFLSSGSINDPKTSRYHLELSIEKPKEAVFVQKLLNLFELNIKMLTRDKNYMLYIKEAEKISDFLKILDASQAVMYYENIRVYRDKKNQANRLNNCEQANMDKVVSSATKQLEYIEIIEENMGTSLLDDKTKEALEYRKKYPESSLKELSEIISIETGNKITKSGLNHRFRKIKDLAIKFNK